MPTDAPQETDASTFPTIHEPRLWQDRGWTARVIKNEDDDGWAVEMLREGEPEPALVGPWTMGRDKKNPKPLDVSAFHTLVKTASEVIRRHEQQLHARLHKVVNVQTEQGRIQVLLDIEAQEEEPYAWLTALGASGEQLARIKVAAGFQLHAASAEAWIAKDFARP
ncbi:MAG: hypothetical protein ACK5PH_00805 [Inhella sp.]|jgi:hypothetical protein|uniref:hypothetical protein n=1 Tax=Inhella sp. TaxID=1921806 RepID=UPI00391C11A6